MTLHPSTELVLSEFGPGDESFCNVGSLGHTWHRHHSYNMYLRSDSLRLIVSAVFSSSRPGTGSFSEFFLVVTSTRL